MVSSLNRQNILLGEWRKKTLIGIFAQFSWIVRDANVTSMGQSFSVAIKKCPIERRTLSEGVSGERW